MRNRSERKVKPGDAVEVCWMDAARWSIQLRKDDMHMITLASARSIGYLVDRTDARLVIATSIFDDVPLQFRDVLAIPSDCVINVKHLKPAEESG